MFSDPIVNEWISGLVAALFCGLAVIAVNALVALFVIKIWGEEEPVVSVPIEEDEAFAGSTAPMKISA